MQRTLSGIQQLPWSERTPDPSPIELWDMMKQELTLSPEPATIIANLRQLVFGIIYRRMTFGTFLAVCMREYTPALPPERATL